MEPLYDAAKWKTCVRNWKGNGERSSPIIKLQEKKEGRNNRIFADIFKLTAYDPHRI